jgi:adenylate kinase
VRRHDDEAALVQARVRVFQRAVGPVLEFYRQSGRLRIIEVDDTPAVVHERVLNVVRGLDSGQPPAPVLPGEFELPDWHRAPAGPAAAVARAGLGLALLGGPGSGKGTQADALSRELHLPHLSTGDLFRENLRLATKLGKLSKGYMDRGELVPDEITEAMVRERLGRPDTAAGFLLDGFPRTRPQAEALNDMATDLHRPLAGVIFIQVSDDEIVRRLSGRLICRQCQSPYHLQFKPPKQDGRCDGCGGELYQRDDDNPVTVRARLKTFHAQTEPLIGYYRHAGLLTEIDGEGDVPAVTAATLKVAQQLKSV